MPPAWRSCVLPSGWCASSRRQAAASTTTRATAPSSLKRSMRRRSVTIAAGTPLAQAAATPASVDAMPASTAATSAAAARLVAGRPRESTSDGMSGAGERCSAATPSDDSTNACAGCRGVCGGLVGGGSVTSAACKHLLARCRARPPTCTARAHLQRCRGGVGHRRQRGRERLQPRGGGHRGAALRQHAQRLERSAAQLLLAGCAVVTSARAGAGGVSTTGSCRQPQQAGDERRGGAGCERFYLGLLRGGWKVHGSEVTDVCVSGLADARQQLPLQMHALQMRPCSAATQAHTPTWSARCVLSTCSAVARSRGVAPASPSTPSSFGRQRRPNASDTCTPDEAVPPPAAASAVPGAAVARSWRCSLTAWRAACDCIFAAVKRRSGRSAARGGQSQLRSPRPPMSPDADTGQAWSCLGHCCRWQPPCYGAALAAGLKQQRGAASRAAWFV